MEIAYFAAGCFWGVDKTFLETPGVIDTLSGYMGGHTENPTYENVCSKTTGHAEAVEVQFDPEKVSYEELLKVFWNVHNPTHINRQGLDVGNQYRSAIFYTSEEQKKSAELSKADLESSKQYFNPIATEITQAKIFYKAEEHHQKYFKKNPNAVCQV